MSEKKPRKKQPPRQISVTAKVYQALCERARRDGVTITSLVEAAVTRGLDGERLPPSGL